MQLAAARLPTLFTGATITLQNHAFFSSLCLRRPTEDATRSCSPPYSIYRHDENFAKSSVVLLTLFETTDRGCNSQLLASLLYLQRELLKVKRFLLTLFTGTTISGTFLLTLFCTIIEPPIITLTLFASKYYCTPRVCDSCLSLAHDYIADFSASSEAFTKYAA